MYKVVVENYDDYKFKNHNDLPYFFLSRIKENDHSSCSWGKGRRSGAQGGHLF